MEYKTLWTTEHGSAMWDMFVPGVSDHDYATCRIVPTKCQMSGYELPKTWPGSTERGSVDIDHSYIEIGHLITLILKGDINHLWQVMSPIIVEDHTSGLLSELREIVLHNPSKKCYFALKGMAGSQKLDETKRPRLAGGKGYRTAARTALFGVRLLTSWKFDFRMPQTIINTSIDEGTVNTYLDALDEAFAASPYPITPDPTPFRNFLFRARRMEYEGAL